MDQGKMKKYTVTIRDNVKGEDTVFETNGILGAFINKEFGGGNSDTSQFLLGGPEEKELIKLLAGCTNMIYQVSKSEKDAEKFIALAHYIAKEGYKQNEYREGI